MLHTTRPAQRQTQTPNPAAPESEITSVTTPARGGTHGAQLLYPRLSKAPVETTWDVFVLACLSAC